MKPEKKVTAGGIAGSLSIIIVWVFGEFGLPMPAEIAAAFATLVSFVAAYFIRSEKKES